MPRRRRIALVNWGMCPLVVKGHMPHIAYDKRDYHVEESKAGSRGKSLQRDRDA
jgi:hypothetical protein